MGQKDGHEVGESKVKEPMRTNWNPQGCLSLATSHFDGAEGLLMGLWLLCTAAPSPGLGFREAKQATGAAGPGFLLYKKVSWQINDNLHELQGLWPQCDPAHTLGLHTFTFPRRL